MCEEYSIELRPGIVYNPRSNFTERYNGTIGDMLRAYANNNPKKWDEFLPEFQHALRTGVNATTGYSPYQVVFGEDIVMDGRMHLFIGGDADLACEDRAQYAAGKQRLELLRDEVVLNLQQAQGRNTRRFNLRRRADPFKIGDVVLRKNFAKSQKAKGIAKKLLVKWLGPYTIRKKLGATGYMLQDPQGKEEGPYHPDQLKKYFS